MIDPLGASLDDLEARSGVMPSGPEFGDPVGRRFKAMRDHYSLVAPGSMVGPADPSIAQINAAIGGGVVTIPVNTVLPVISGAAQVGETLTSTVGTWTGGGMLTYAYQWKSAGSNVGTNQNTYVPVTGDIGNTITCTVTATNTAGSTAATSAATSAVISADLPAVHFDGSTAWLQRGASLFDSNYSQVLVSVWLANFDPGGIDAVLFATTPGVYFFMSLGTASPPQSPGTTLYADTYAPYLHIANGAVDCDVTGPTWHHWLCKYDVSKSGYASAGQLVIDGVYQTQVDDTSPFTGPDTPFVPFSTNLTEETDFIFGGEDAFGDVSKFDVAQFYMAVGSNADIDLSNPANVAKFIAAGKPVDLLTSGAPTALVLFDGDASTFGTNQGTGGAFTLTGSLTNAATSPSD